MYKNKGVIKQQISCCEMVCFYIDISGQSISLVKHFITFALRDIHLDRATEIKGKKTESVIY